MKKTTITMLCLAACLAAADTKITWLADVTADRAETVTGVQSGQVANAAAHIVRTDNPHGVTAPQIGAITVELDPVANAALVVHTNRIDNPHAVTAQQIGALTSELDPVANAALVVHTNRTDNPHGVTAPQIGALTNETDEAALAAMPFNLFDATKNVIWKGAGTNANTTQSILIGDRAGNAVTGSTIIAIGRDAAREIALPGVIDPEAELSIIAIGENAAEQAGGMFGFAYNIAIGNSAFKEGSGHNSIAIGQDALDKSPGAFTSIAIGCDAGRTAAAENMIAIGYQAGEQAGLTNSVVIGANAGRRASGQNLLVIDSSGNDDTDYPARAMIYGNADDLTLGRIDSDNVLRGNWLFNNNRILTNELDLAALQTYHYGSPDIVESPAGWFVFDGAGTITGFNWAAGRTNVVIPWEIDGVPVTAIGGNAFASSGIVSLIAPQTVTMIGDSAFVDCSSLTSVSLPQVQTVGNGAFESCESLTSVSLPQVQTVGAYAFNYCTSLTSVSLPRAQTVGTYAFANCLPLASVSLPHAQTVGTYAFANCLSLASVYFDNDAPTIGADMFANITPNQVTIYVTNPQATGWGATFGGMPGMPVVRLPLYADAIYQAGELVATTGYVAHASLADADGYTTQMVMRVGSEIATNRWGPRLTLPDGIVTNGMGGATIGGVVVSNGYILSGVSSPVVIEGFGGVQYNRFIFRTPSGVNGGALIAGDNPFVQFCAFNFDPLADFGFAGSDIWFVNRKTGKLRFGHQGKEDELMVTGSGDVSVKNSLTVGRTNTAAEVRTLGGYSIFDSGSNCYWRVTASNGTFYASDTNGVRTIEISPAVNSIVRGVSVSSTNILVSSTNSVYYVALDTAANIGFDFSALSLGGTKRADITAVIDCLNTQALYSAINTNLVAMDCPWEPTVTGRYELAVSSDGVRTQVRQVWPQVEGWRTLRYTYAPGGGWIDSLQRFQVDNSRTNSLTVDPEIVSPLIFVRFCAFLNSNKPVSFEYGYASVIGPGTDKPSVVYGPFESGHGDFVDVARPVEFGAETSAGRLLQVWIGNQSPEAIATVMFYPSRSRARAANALERAAYNAGAYPAAFRLDY